jgi:transposase-like protein
MRKNWTDEEVLNIIKMKSKMSVREVAKQTGLSQTQIHYALYNYKFKGAPAPEKSLWDRIKELFS